MTAEIELTDKSRAEEGRAAERSEAAQRLAVEDFKGALVVRIEEEDESSYECCRTC